jgi:hypothetical protein
MENGNRMTSQQDEFDNWFGVQNQDRIQIVFDRAVKTYDEQYIGLNNTGEYIDDNDFMDIFTKELNHVWITDTVWSLQRKGLISLEVVDDGTLGATITPNGEVQVQLMELSNQYV